MLPENQENLESSPSLKVEKPQLIQHTRKLKRVKFKGVIRCFAIGELANQQKFVAVGSQDNCLTILNSNFDITYQTTFSQWVRCVAIGDIDQDGKVEIVAGLGDKTVRMLKQTEDSWEEIGQFECTGFVSSVSIANITGTLGDTDVQNEVVVGSWDKTVRVMRFASGICEQVWHRTFDHKILAIRVQDLTGSGKNEVIIALKGGGLTVLHGFDGATMWEIPDLDDILAMDVGLQDLHGNPVILIGGNEKILSILSNQGDLMHQIHMEDRITALKIQDIDGNAVPNVVLGLGQKQLTVLSLANPSLESLHTKWDQRIHGVINAIEVNDINQDDKVEILYGGYSQTLQSLQDNYYGEPAPFERSPSMPSSMPEMVGIENRPTQSTSALVDGSMAQLNADQSLFRTGDDAARPLGAAEYSSEDTTDHEKLYNSSDLDQAALTHSKPAATTESRSSGNAQAGNETKTAGSSQTDDFRITGEPGRPLFVMQIFENVEFFPTKATLLAAIVSGGLSSKQSLKMFAEFKEMNYIRYQRAAPRGYYLNTEGEPQETQSKPKARASSIPKVPASSNPKVPASSTSKPGVSKSLPFLEQAQGVLSSITYFPTKDLLITAFREGGIPEKEILPSIEYFKTKSLLSYSRKTPRGYHYLPDQTSVISGSEITLPLLQVSPEKISSLTKVRESMKTHKSAAALSDDLSTLLKELFVQKPHFPSKAAYLSALETKFHTSTELSPEKLFLLFKNHGLVQYSRAKPRGYFLTSGEN